MFSLLQKTGPYVHAPDDLLRLRFETGGTPRLFTLLLAQGAERGRFDPTVAGLVILDEDEGRVLLDSHTGEPARPAASELYRISALSWADFSAFCRAHPRYRPGAPDIDTPHEAPLPGSRSRQARLAERDGAEPVIGRPLAGDLRSDLMRRADADPACPVRFPARDRTGMMRDLKERVMRDAESGLFRPGWRVPLPTAPDLTGVNGAVPVDRSLDIAWSSLLEERPELAEEARIRAIEPVLAGRLATWGAEDEGRYDLRLSNTEEGPAVLLRALDDFGIGAASADAFGIDLERLPDPLLRDLWKLGRTLDLELSPERVGVRFGHALNATRAETEAMRDTAPVPSGP
jgi:hypothetical protein